MGKQVKGLLYFYLTDARHSVLIFWSILLFFLVTAIAFAYFLLGVEDGKIAFGFPFAIYVYCLIFGFRSVKESIPFAIKVGAVRKNIAISIGLFFFGLAASFAIIASTLQEVVSLLINRMGVDSFSFMHFAMLLDDTWFNRILIDTCVMFFCLSLMYIFGLLFYKYGLAGGGLLAGILGVALLVGIAKGWVFDAVSQLISPLHISFFFELLGVGILIYGLSYILIRRITI